MIYIKMSLRNFYVNHQKKQTLQMAIHIKYECQKKRFFFTFVVIRKTGRNERENLVASSLKRL